MATSVIASPASATARPYRVHAPAVLFWLGWIVGLCQFQHADYGFGRGIEMPAIARSLAERGAFADPFTPAVTGPTAMEPPIHPLFLAAWIVIFRTPVAMVLMAVLTGILANASIAALLPRMARILYGDSTPGIVAGVLWIAAMRLFPEWDTSNTIVGLFAFCLLTDRRLRTREAGAWALAAGTLAGFLVLLNPATALVTAPWLLWLFVVHRIPLRRAVRYSALAAIAASLAVSPWVWRNYRIWGAFAMRTNLGLTLYTSNNDCAEASLYQEQQNGCVMATFPTYQSSEAHLLADLGEVRYDRLRSADARRWIVSHPARFLQLTARRVVNFWFPEPHQRPFLSYLIWAITLLSIPGLVWSIRRRQPVAPLILGIWAVYPLMYYIVVSSDRYRYPILWTSLLPAGYALQMAASAWKHVAQKPTGAV